MLHRAFKSMPRTAYTARPVTSRIPARTSTGWSLKEAAGRIIRICDAAPDQPLQATHVAQEEDHEKSPRIVEGKDADLVRVAGGHGAVSLAGAVRRRRSPAVRRGRTARAGAAPGRGIRWRTASGGGGGGSVNSVILNSGNGIMATKSGTTANIIYDLAITPSQIDATKLMNISDYAINYGGTQVKSFKAGSNTAMSIDANGVLTVSSSGGSGGSDVLPAGLTSMGSFSATTSGIPVTRSITIFTNVLNPIVSKSIRLSLPYPSNVVKSDT